MSNTHVEVVRKYKPAEFSPAKNEEIEANVANFLLGLDGIAPKMPILINAENSPGLAEFIEEIYIDDLIELPLKKENLIFHFYKPSQRECEVETFESDSGDGEEVPASNHWLLPSKSFLGLWDSLIYEEGLKEKILKFAESALFFASHRVDQNIISCNRIILLHGPPGTGKTSLCKAVAQKLSVRMDKTYKFTHLIEINSHSLFSKWFSESGKLVMKLFSKVKEIISQPKSLVCILIDEVESIAYARASMSGQEPKDAMRVVNALLTQLDSIKHNPNVLILATSNLASTIDLAFIDRADIKQYVGLPNVEAVYQIYSSMLRELMSVKIISEYPLPSTNTNQTILELSKLSIGLSGRTLRKIPFLAHALCLETCSPDDIIPFADFCSHMTRAITKHFDDQKKLKENHL